MSLLVPVTSRGAALEIGAPQALFKAPPLAFWVLDHDGKRFLLGRVPEASQTTPITLLTHWTTRLKRPT